MNFCTFSSYRRADNALLFKILYSVRGAGVAKSACVLAKVLQLCLTLGDPIDFSLLDFSVHGDSPGKNTGVDPGSGMEPTMALALMALVKIFPPRNLVGFKVTALQVRNKDSETLNNLTDGDTS